MQMRKSITFIIIVAALLTGTFSAAAQFYNNPVLQSGADPWITCDGTVTEGGHYYYCSARRGGIAVGRFDNLCEPDAGQVVWRPGNGQWNSTCIWAPELHKWNGRWYIVYAAGYSGPPYIHQRTGVLESVTEDPLGEYVSKGMVNTGDDPFDPSSVRWAIDMTYLQHKGKLYAIWSGWENLEPTDKTPQNLYIAEMENPWTVKSPRVLISRPDREWEICGSLPINEGPQVLCHRKKVFIVYSCGQSWLPTYKLGMLTLKKGGDPLDPASWTKSSEPVFQGNEEIHGVGHASFTVSPDGREHYIVYHSKKGTEDGWRRDVRIQKFRFKCNGTPDFGEPQPLSDPLPLPSGTRQE